MNGFFVHKRHEQGVLHVQLAPVSGIGLSGVVVAEQQHRVGPYQEFPAVL